MLVMESTGLSERRFWENTAGKAYSEVPEGVASCWLGTDWVSQEVSRQADPGATASRPKPKPAVPEAWTFWTLGGNAVCSVHCVMLPVKSGQPCKAKGSPPADPPGQGP